MFSVHPQLNNSQEGRHSLPPLSHIITTALPSHQTQNQPQQQQQQQQQQHLPPPPQSSQQHIPQSLGYTHSDSSIPVKREDQSVSPPLHSHSVSPIDGKSGPSSPKYSLKQPTDRCTCKHDGNHIPRPRNAFILFRQQHHQSVLDEGNVVKSNPDVSRELGKRWRDLSPQEKDYWNKLAEDEKKRHAEKYPGYRYIPRRFGKKGSCPYCKNKATSKQLKQQSEASNSGQYSVPSLTSSASTTPDELKPYTPSLSEEHAIAQSFLNLRNQPQQFYPDTASVGATAPSVPQYQFHQLPPAQQYYQQNQNQLYYVSSQPSLPHYSPKNQLPSFNSIGGAKSLTELPKLQLPNDTREAVLDAPIKTNSCAISNFLN